MYSSKKQFSLLIINSHHKHFINNNNNLQNIIDITFNSENPKHFKHLREYCPRLKALKVKCIIDKQQVCDEIDTFQEIEELDLTFKSIDFAIRNKQKLKQLKCLSLCKQWDQNRGCINEQISIDQWGISRALRNKFYRNISKFFNQINESFVIQEFKITLIQQYLTYQRFISWHNVLRSKVVTDQNQALQISDKFQNLVLYKIIPLKIQYKKQQIMESYKYQQQVKHVVNLCMVTYDNDQQIFQMTELNNNLKKISINSILINQNNLKHLLQKSVKLEMLELITLKTLNLIDQKVEDIMKIKNNLVGLVLNGNHFIRLKHIEINQNFSNLKSLGFANCPYINDMQLSRLILSVSLLQDLDLSGCKLYNKVIIHLKKLKQLKTLKIANNKITLPIFYQLCSNNKTFLTIHLTMKKLIKKLFQENFSQFSNTCLQLSQH